MDESWNDGEGTFENIHLVSFKRSLAVNAAGKRKLGRIETIEGKKTRGMNEWKKKEYKSRKGMKERQLQIRSRSPEVREFRTGTGRKHEGGREFSLKNERCFEERQRKMYASALCCLCRCVLSVSQCVRKRVYSRVRRWWLGGCAWSKCKKEEGRKEIAQKNVPRYETDPLARELNGTVQTNLPFIHCKFRIPN